MLNILTFHQIAALLVLFLSSMIIAFCPLLFLRWFYKRKKRRLRRLNQNQHQQKILSSISEIALASTLYLPNILLDLLRSLNGGLLLASLFLILFPQLRSNFDALMNSYVYKSHINLPLLPRPEAINRNDLSWTNHNKTIETSSSETNESESNRFESNIHSNNNLVSKFSPIPIVEVILCLAFFTLYFVEEFTQLCFRYRKYFWACNSAVVFSSSDGRCNYTSLDYRINCTKRFLIDCSRKTFTTSNFSSEEASNRSTPSTMVSNDNNDNNQELKTSSKASSSADDLVKNDSDVVQHPQHQKQQQPQLHYDSISSFPKPDNNNTNNSNNDDSNSFEPQSLLSNSSAHLPSYYWQSANHPQQTTVTNIHPLNCVHNFRHNHPHHHCHYPHHNQLLLPYNVFNNQQNQMEPNSIISIDFYDEKDQYNQTIVNETKSKEIKKETKDENSNQKQTEAQLYYCCCYCCNCNQSHIDDENQNQEITMKRLNCNQNNNTLDGDSTSASTTTISTIRSHLNGFTKIFLPNTTQATNIPAIYIGEGILIGIQPSVALIWLMLSVMLVHKLVVGLLMATELHHKTTGRQKNLPSSTIILFTSLPSLGCLTVILSNVFMTWKINLDLATKMDQTIPLEYAILKVVLVSLSSATLLHLIMLTIQQRHNYWLLPNNIPSSSSSSSSSSQFQLENRQKTNKVRKWKFNKKQINKPEQKKNSTTLKTSSFQSASSNSHNSRIFLNSFPSTTTALSKQASMTVLSTASSSSGADCHNIPIQMENSNGYPLINMALDPTARFITNPPKNNVLHYFTMYSGFIIILMAIAFLNIKNFKL